MSHPFSECALRALAQFSHKAGVLPDSEANYGGFGRTDPETVVPKLQGFAFAYLYLTRCPHFVTTISHPVTMGERQVGSTLIRFLSGQGLQKISPDNRHR